MTDLLGKYRYAALILLIGLALMLIPGTPDNREPSPTEPSKETTISGEAELEAILSNIRGAGRVEVLLSYAAGERTVYQTDSDAGSQGHDTVIISDEDRKQSGLITQIVPPVYQGAIIVCQGAGDPSVRLSIVDAVSKYTGLGSNQIAVLEMK